MPEANLAEAAAGFLLVFFVPGFTVTRALFPEWRIRGASRWLRLVETLTLSFVLSVVLTVCVGYLWLAGSPGGFQAAWTDPILEASLAAIAIVAAVVGLFRGAYRKEPPPHPASAAEPAADPLALTRELDRLAREERRIRHELRVGALDASERSRLSARLKELRSETEELGRREEARYAD